MAYVPTEWKKGDVITDVLLNKLENAVEELGRSVPEAETLATDSKDGLLARTDFSKLAKITGDKQLTPLSIDASLSDVVNKVNEIIGILIASGLAEKEMGLWGTSPWSFDETSGVLTIEAGQVSGHTTSPWNRTDDAKLDPLLIKEIVLAGDVVAPSDSQYLFSDTSLRRLSNVTSINVENLDTSQVTNMKYMFQSASSLTSLDVSGFDTSQVTSMEGMFNEASSLTSLDVSGFDTSQVTSMRTMFHSASSLTPLDVSGFDTSQVTNIGDMFHSASSLTSLDVSGWDTSQVTDMNALFRGASSLTSLDVSEWDTSKVGVMTNVFNGASSLTSLDLSEWDTSKVGVMTNVFTGVKLKKLTLGDTFKFIATSGGLGAPLGLNDSYPLTGKWIREDGQSKGYSPADFMRKYGTDDLTAGTYVAEKRPVWGTSLYEFDEDGTLKVYAGTLDVSRYSPWNRTDEHAVLASEIKKIELIGDVKAPEDAAYLFSSATAAKRLTNVTSINVENLDTSQTTAIGYAFAGCTGLSELDASSWNTSKVESVYSMFDGCSSLLELDVSSWNTSNVVSFGSMFYKCSSLLELDISSFSTSNASSMSFMFSNVSKLEKLTLGASFRFIGTTVDLGVPASSYENTGKWQKDDKTSTGYTPAEFIANYGKGDLTPGAYVAEAKGPNELTKEQLKAILDGKKVSYKSNDTKADLIKMIERVK